MIENVDYEIVPSHEDEQAWNVRVLQGPYTETVLKFGTITLKEKNMSFNFDIIYSPDSELTVKDVDLQDFAGAMLEKIIAQGIKDGDILTKEVKVAN